MSLEWRVVQLGRESGIFNTLLDEVLVEEVEARKSPPTILFSEWKPTVSIGANQHAGKDVDWEACKKYGVEVVRRKSGGKAVYLHEGYMVFSVIAPRELFAEDITQLQKEVCRIPEYMLQQAGVPARFYPPDNLVVGEGNVRTMGNAGQFIGAKSFFLHGSVRYRLSRFNELMDVLKVEDRKIQPYADAMRSVLADVYEYNANLNKDFLKKIFVEGFFQNKPWTYRHGVLSVNEQKKVQERIGERRVIVDEPHYVSKGICYLFLGKRNLVPELYEVAAHE